MPTELDLENGALRAAYQLQQKCPWVVFTSGRRNWREQAYAMAVNVSHKRDWLGLVYKREPELQAWVDAHPEVVAVTDLTNGLMEVLLSLPDHVRDRFAHPAGRAFDLAVPTLQWREPTTEVIKCLPALERFLEGEGGLSIWHCQFIKVEG